VIPSAPLPVNRLLAWLGIAVLLGLLLWVLGPVLAPFVTAAVLAYVLQPLVRRLAPPGAGEWRRVLSVLLVEAIALAALAGLMLLMVPVLVREWPLLRQQLPGLLDRLDAVLSPLLGSLGLSFSLDLQDLKTQLLEWLSTHRDGWQAPLLASLKVGGSLALTVAGYAVLVPVALFFMLKDWDRLVNTLLELVPPRWRATVDGFVEECDAVLGEYLRGQLLVMGVLAVYYTVALALFGLELALPIGVFTGLAVFVPYLGFGLGLALALLAALLQFAPGHAVVVVALVYGFGQLFESFGLTPRLVGQRIGLHPLAVILALMAFGQLLGFVGVLMALPASAVLLVALRRLRRRYLGSEIYCHGPAGSDGP
jgi:predicted PurR-regulated permease PerM